MLRMKLNRVSFFVLGICMVLALFACASDGAATGGAGGAPRGGEPEWVRDPYSKYDKNANVAAVGDGSGREIAEKSAMANLVKVFGQEIQVDEKISVLYQEAVKSGVTANWSENTTVDNTIATTAGLDSLVGAEIGEVWSNVRGQYFAVAVLNKQKAAGVYTNMVKSNQTMINDLTTMSDAQKNTLDGYSRYQFAATIADINVSYGNLLSVIGAPMQGLRKGDDYRLEAANIAKAIPVFLRVQNDRSGRMQGAFAKALADVGFRTGGNNSRYLLDVKVAISEVVMTGNPNKFSRIEVTADLTDTTARTVLVPYNFNLREGHTSQAEADNRTVLAAERKINEEYAKMLNEYLSQLLPKK